MSTHITPLRYVPELQSLCARNIAGQIRELSIEERYKLFQKIPDHLSEIIKAFPTNFVLWSIDNDFDLNYNNNFGIDYSDVFIDAYHDECNRGNVRDKVINRSCANVYCDNTIKDTVIGLTPYRVKYSYCEMCKKYRLLISEHIKLKIGILKHSFTRN